MWVVWLYLLHTSPTLLTIAGLCSLGLHVAETANSNKDNDDKYQQSRPTHCSYNDYNILINTATATCGSCEGGSVWVYGGRKGGGREGGRERGETERERERDRETERQRERDRETERQREKEWVREKRFPRSLPKTHFIDCPLSLSI